uniref:Uncharacterized protein n=1 Tax=Strigamia maritima TaxID=126957 RepID=T1JHS2_STRMM
MQVQMDNDDDKTVFSVEAALDQKMYVWADKYQPRKPRYYNRVHIPDLIDKSIPPSYKLFLFLNAIERTQHRNRGQQQRPQWPHLTT